MRDSGVSAQQFARQAIAYLAGSVGAAVHSVQNVVQLSIKCLAYGKWTGRGRFAVNVGAAGNQWPTITLAKRDGNRVITHPESQ